MSARPALTLATVPGAETGTGVPVPSRAAAAEARAGDLFSELDACADAAGRRAVRHELVRIHLPLADFLARRFRNRGEPIEDLRQVASIGLIKAIDGYDPNRGSTFRSYAIPTILGELRRHFRDKGWQVRAPRRLQELRADIIAAREPLTQSLGRSPNRAELAGVLRVTETEVDQGLLAAQAYSATSLQSPISPDGTATLGDVLPGPNGGLDNGFEVVEARETLRAVLGGLPERERRILGLRFYHQLSQSEISTELGISQMHVSRLLTRSLGYLRDQLQPAG